MAHSMNLKTIYRRVCDKISFAGMEVDFNIYKKKRLVAFNRISVFSLFIATVWFVFATKASNQISSLIVLCHSLPLVVQIVSIILMHLKRQKLSIYISIVATPSLIALSSFFTADANAVLYILVYALMPFFFHNKMKKISLNYVYVAFLYCVALYNMVDNYANSSFRLSILLHLLLLGFVYMIFYTVKIQVIAYENSLRLKNSIIDAKNEELNKLLVLKKQILTTISHDVVTPLANLKSLVTENSVASLDAQEVEMLLPVVRQEVSKTHDLFESLLKWSNTQAGNTDLLLINFNLGALVDKAIMHTSYQAGLKRIMLFNYIEPGLTVLANEDNLLVALRNLIANAIKYTNEKGKICIDAGVEGNFVKIAVKDNGIGMVKETQEKLFADIRFTKAGTIGETGSGLGLKIAKQLLQESNGKLYCADSTVGLGTTFVIEFPITRLDKKSVLESVVL
jgi:signal transduction histidine kinase